MGRQQPLLPIDRPKWPVDLFWVALARLSQCRQCPLPTNDQITEALRAVIDPELRRSIVDLGMVRSIEVFDNGNVDVVVSLTTAGCPIRNHFQQAVARTSPALDGVTDVGVGFDVLSDAEKANLQQALGRPAASPRARSRRSRTSSASPPARAASASRR